MPRQATPKLDPRPLREAMGRAGLTYSELARRVGSERNTLRRRMNRPVRWDGADLLATAIGCHPGDIWGSAWWDLLAELDRAERERRAARTDRAFASLRRTVAA